MLSGVRARCPTSQAWRARCGPGGNRTPCIERRLVYSQLRPMARPTQLWGQVAPAQIKTMPMRLSRCCGPEWVSGAHARKESNPRPAVLETAAPPWLERKKSGKNAQAVVRAKRKLAGTRRLSVELPADDDGSAGIGGFPSS